MLIMENKIDESNSNKLLFEFIVDQNQFTKLITNTNGKINLDLISQFLNQFLLSSKDLYNNEEITDLDLLESSLENEYKLKVIKNLAIKIASHTKFDLNILHSSLSVAILNTLLIEFYKLFGEENLSSLDDINFQAIGPTGLFAISLYHRWCLKLITDDVLLKKPQKVTNIQFPIDTTNSIGIKDSIIKKIKERQHISIHFLEKFLSQCPPISVIQSECILFDEKRLLKYDWSKAFEIKPNEHLSLIAYDLGCTYFYIRKFEQAFGAFKFSREMFQNISSGYLPSLDLASLEGYLKTCSAITGNIIHSPFTLVEKVQESLRSNFLGLTGLLLEDIIKKELDLSLRVCLQEQAMNSKRQDSLYEEIVVCNSIREALEGRVVYCKLINILSNTKGIIDFFIKVCVDVYLCISNNERQNLKTFLKFLTTTLPLELNFVALMLASPLNEMFSSIDFSYDPQFKVANLETGNMALQLIDANSEEERLYNFELELSNTFEIERIKSLINRILHRNNDFIFKNISSRLILSNDWRFWFDQLPNLHPNLKILIQILIIKSNISYMKKDYETGWNMLQYLDLQMCQQIKNSNNYVKQLRLHILKMGLAAANQTPPYFLTGSSAIDLVHKCKFFVMNFDFDIGYNTDKILCKIVCFLINNNEFQFLSSYSSFNNNFLQLGAKLAMVLQDLEQNNSIRLVAKDFICFLKDLCLTSVTQNLIRQFIKYIKSEIVLTVLISAFAKLYIVSDTKVSYQIFAEFSTIWPTAITVSENECLDPNNVFCILKFLINSALHFNSRQLSWIRSKADLFYISKEFNVALKYYIELLTLITNYFLESIPNNAITDLVIKKMIYSCNQIGCYTQAAVLCQFLEEIDYTTLFSNLQEKQVCDAMDEYYQFFWDTTVLEFLVNLHSKRGEVSKRNYCIKLIGELELNSSNPFEILMEASRMRRMGFMRTLARQFITQPSQLLTIDIL